MDGDQGFFITDVNQDPNAAIVEEEESDHEQNVNDDVPILSAENEPNDNQNEEPAAEE